jgi:L-proline---[L-prolyl-carrier protein] ligase
VTAKDGATPTTDDLAEHLDGRLPWYAIPARITVIAEFPRTSTGKIDRRALADQFAS